ncbi:hypothetical protein LZD49_26030 [Dyadobacter sp. CY261]|uniref:hypothetical protein n=1 Tax=Dyadobacter sp. CY261 TaxID=2907203 RepID=UPI001F2F8016|nr:hypothetical protein [Dyadobacter sp. CY261]MCF0073967.1 hypothetical protein [Dyadobacter sp. CY261]
MSSLNFDAMFLAEINAITTPPSARNVRSIFDSGRQIVTSKAFPRRLIFDFDGSTLRFIKPESQASPYDKRCHCNNGTTYWAYQNPKAIPNVRGVANSYRLSVFAFI